MDATDVPAALADRLGPEATFGLVELLGASGREWVELTMTQAADRFERRLVEETSKLRVEMVQGHAALREDIGALRHDLAAQRFDLLKWSFVFWIGQVAVIAGVVTTVLRLSGR